jgi:hypothetical protein
MINCPKCDKKKTLKEWWKSCRKRQEWITEWQTKFVANNAGIGVKVDNDPKYKQSERILKKLGFYDPIEIR